MVVSVDESRDQTRAILEAQRRAEAGRPGRDAVLRRHHALQRCLRPMAIANPYAPALSFPDHMLAARREQPKYLGLIRAVALLRQHPRVDLPDIEVANRLADAILGQSLEDLSPPARRLLSAIHAWKPQFERRALAAHLSWPASQLHKYLRELVEGEWVIDRGGRPRRFDLLWDGREGRVMLGLRSIAEIRAQFGRNSRGCGGSM
jgi:hypothetical protein